MVTVGAGAELIASIKTATRALVLISVPWSAPERIARDLFQSAIVQLKESNSDAGIAFFRLEVDEDEVSREWLRSVGFIEFASLGAGSLLWLEAGQVISSETSANSLGVSGIVHRSQILWTQRN